MTAPGVAVTGGHGFLGWHTACRLRAVHGVATVRLGRRETAEPETLARHLEPVDTVIHLAGVNRAATEEEVESGNVAAAEALAGGLRRRSRPVHVVYAGSVHSGRDSGYGRGKAAAKRVLAAAVGDVGGTLAEVVLPNVFGEHGRPAYNSFVATFCHEVAAGRRPAVTGGRAVPLLHAQRAAAVLAAAALEHADGRVTPEGEPREVGEVLALLERFHRTYAGRGELPDLADAFIRDLFNTYRSHLWPRGFPREVTVHRDDRGDLVEGVRSHGGTGQAFWSSTRPGATRGDHYHLQRVERFLVVRGEAEIVARRLLSDEVVRFAVSGDRPALVDLPTLWAHRLRNVGDGELLTLFWSDQLLDPDAPDQYPERVLADEPALAAAERGGR